MDTIIPHNHTHLPSPGPTDVTEAQLQALARHYLDPSTGLYNYLRFHADIIALEREEEGRDCSEPPRPPSAKVGVNEACLCTSRGSFSVCNEVKTMSSPHCTLRMQHICNTGGHTMSSRHSMSTSVASLVCGV